MKRLGLLTLVVCALAIGCDDDNPTSPTNAPFVFTASLQPANEVPPIANAEASGIGAVQITVDATRDSSNTITGGNVTFHFQLSGFPAGTSVVGAHIHQAPPGVNGAIVVNTGVGAGNPVTFANGVATFTASGIPASAAIIQGMLNNPTAFYFNVHSPLNPGGFARGPLVRVQ